MQAKRLDVQKALIDRIQPDKDRWHRLNDSKTWYVTPEQTKGYLDAHHDKIYAAQMLKPEQELLKSILQEHRGRLQPIRQLVDLGPGAADKARIILEALPTIKHYTAIDISETMLEYAAKQLEDKDIRKNYYLGDFATDLPQLKPNLNMTPALIYIGATYANYPPTFLEEIKNIMRPDDRVYISAQRKPDDVEAVLEAYCQPQYSGAFTAAIKQIGFTFDKVDVRFNEKNNTIENYITVKNIPDVIRNAKKDLCIGDHIVLFTSRKPTPVQFVDETNTVFTKGMYEIGDDFMGALCYH